MSSRPIREVIYWKSVSRLCGFGMTSLHSQDSNLKRIDSPDWTPKVTGCLSKITCVTFSGMVRLDNHETDLSINRYQEVLWNMVNSDDHFRNRRTPGRHRSRSGPAIRRALYEGRVLPTGTV